MRDVKNIIEDKATATTNILTIVLPIFFKSLNKPLTLRKITTANKITVAIMAKILELICSFNICSYSLKQIIL